MVDIYQPKLIEEVKKRPGLWSGECPVDRDERLSLWKEVGAVMFKDWHGCSKATVYDRVLQLQKKWRSLRDAYKREIRTRKSGHRVAKTSYRFFRNMTFLGGSEGIIGTCDDVNGQESIVPENNDSTYHDHDDNLENCPTMNIETLDENSENDDSNSDPLVQLSAMSTSKSSTVEKKTKRQAKKRKTSSEDEREEMEIPIYSLDMNEREQDTETDTDKLFLMSFLPQMKQLPVNIKMWVRAQIANTMQEAVNCHYNKTVPTGMGIKRQRQESSE